VLVQDALFATLEPTTRRADLFPGSKTSWPVVLTDTVGFVRHLPTQLVEAFRSTLEEVVDADLLVHVVDGADASPLGQINAVRQVISEVISEHGADQVPELLVVNKIDAASDLALAKLRHVLPGAVFVSARTGDGIDALRRRMAELAAPTDAAVDVVIRTAAATWCLAYTRTGGCNRPSTPPRAPGSGPGFRRRLPPACGSSALPSQVPRPTVRLVYLEAGSLSRRIAGGRSQ